MLDIWVDEYERGAIGIISLYYGEAQIFRTALTPEDFSDPRAASIFEMFLQSNEHQGFLNKVYADKNINLYLSECMGSSVSFMGHGHWETVVDIVASRSRNRRLIAGVQDIIATRTATELLPALGKYISAEQEKASSKIDKEQPQQLAESAIAAMLDNEVSQRIFTGIKPVDMIVRGLRRGNVSVLGAAPSVGKTAFALNVAHHALKQGKSVLIFSLEMADIQLVDRMVANAAELDYNAINNKTLTEREKDYYSRTAKQLVKDNRLYIFDTCCYLEQMADHIITLKPDLVIVDFLQFARTKERHNSVADRLEYMVSEFKRVAKLPFCPCHIMLLSQPSRQAAGGEQSMFNLKGSSAIEQGGDIVLLLSRPAIDGDKNERSKCAVEQTCLTVGKNKFGKTGKASLYFDGRYQRFREEQVGDIFTKPDGDEKPWQEADTEDWYLGQEN